MLNFFAIIMSTNLQRSSNANRISPKTVEIHIRRRANPDSPQYWERFEITYRPNLNIISCLMEIQKNPVTSDGQPTTPPV
ncbi:MAG: hypothetical protein M3Q91_11175, partial [Acidobacteriota bacterium]|nr:hypothetical protein [Acidobacteriota bacterium]